MGRGSAAAHTRAAIEGAIEALIGLLDAMDGDTDCEAEGDASADDMGEPRGATWLQAPVQCAFVRLAN